MNLPAHTMGLGQPVCAAGWQDQNSPQGVWSDVPMPALALSVSDAAQIAFGVEKSPGALAAAFVVPRGTDANIETSIKIGQSSNLY